jgi:hypothetical protein
MNTGMPSAQLVEVGVTVAALPGHHQVGLEGDHLLHVDGAVAAHPGQFLAASG